MDNNDIIFKFDGKQGAKIPDGIVPKNLTDQFTIALWMKHGPSPGLRAEKETILCNSDKTGECIEKIFGKGLNKVSSVTISPHLIWSGKKLSLDSAILSIADLIDYWGDCLPKFQALILLLDSLCVYTCRFCRN